MHRAVTVASLIGVLLNVEARAWAEPAAPPAASPKPPAAASAPVAAAPAAKPAKPAKAAPAKSVEQERFDAALHKLASGDPAVVQSGIEALVEHGGPNAERALIERVSAGLPPSLIEPALAALVALKSKKSMPVVMELLEHRRALVRGAALRALSQLDARKPSPLQATFIAALDDSASEVSRAAAEGLGRVGTKAALPALWSAYDKGVTPALASIAELAGVESIEALTTRAQASGIETLEPVVDRMLARNALPAPAQVKLVRAIAATKSEGAHQYLLRWLDRIKLQTSQATVRKELFEALKVFSTPGAASAEPAQEVAVRPAAAPQGGAR